MMKKENKMEAKATYRYLPDQEVSCEVEIEIYIEKTGDDWKFFPAGAALPHGRHRIYWIAKGPDSPVLDALWITQKPPKVQCESPQPDPADPTRWTAVCCNEKPGVSQVNSMSYEFSGHSKRGSFGPGNFQHDPTIAVTNDPPPGDKPPSGAEGGAREAGVAAQRIEER